MNVMARGPIVLRFTDNRGPLHLEAGRCWEATVLVTGWPKETGIDGNLKDLFCKYCNVR